MYYRLLSVCLLTVRLLPILLLLTVLILTVLRLALTVVEAALLWRSAIGCLLLLRLVVTLPVRRCRRCAIALLLAVRRLSVASLVAVLCVLIIAAVALLLMVTVVATVAALIVWSRHGCGLIRVDEAAWMLIVLCRLLVKWM